jgi:hypothetical protein
MAQSPYTPPSAPIRDLGSEEPGPLHDLLAILIALAIAKLLTMVIAEEIVLFLADLVRAELSSDGGFVPFLVIDLILSCASELVAIWVAWRLSRSRRAYVPVAVAAASWIITFVHRWFLNDFGWPQWYEFALLASPPAALLLFYSLARQRGQRVA